MLIWSSSETRSRRQIVGEGIPISMLLAYPSWRLQALKVPFGDEGSAFMLDAAMAESGGFYQKRGGQAALVPSITLDSHDAEKHAEH